MNVVQMMVNVSLRAYYLSLIPPIDERLEKIESVLEQMRAVNGCAAFAGVEDGCADLAAEAASGPRTTRRSRRTPSPRRRRP